MAEPEIICERRGRAGYVRLNRPAALNAITHGMVRELAASLQAWDTDPAIRHVVVTAAGERAFSAGGDIRALYESGTRGDHAAALAFWRDEYRLNIRIKRYGKPYVSLIDGIVMGGGVGLSLHGSHRIAGDRYRFAMPEVGIGFFPDVGATYALPRLPGEAGTYLALTGARVGPDDAARLGLATDLVPSDRHPEALERLLDGEGPDAVAAALGRAPGEGSLGPERATIDGCFSGRDVPDILRRLDEAADAGCAFASETTAAMRTKSPGSLAITLEGLRQGGELDFEDAMANEFRIVSRVVRGRDFYEGVRATLIDRDGAPRWEHSGPEAVDPAWLSGHFAALSPATAELL